MAKRRRTKNVNWLIDQIDAQLKSFKAERHDLDLRHKVLCLVSVFDTVKDIGVNVISEHGWAKSGAKERIRLYLVEYVGEIVDRAELEVVAGISDYPRRIRELRKEEGYQIATGASPDPEAGIDLKPDQYLLVNPDPDEKAARRWHVANRIRRKTISAQDRILEFLQENVLQAVTTEELAYVAKTREFGRRTRELRTEQGWSIATRYTGRPDLSPGQYILQSLEQIKEPHDRKIPEGVQKSVYQRDNNTCRLCGWSMLKWRDTDPRILELHHYQEHIDGGANTEDNLVVLCSSCHDQFHAGRLSFPPNFIVVVDTKSNTA